jgi:hypothetical protein
MQAKQFNCLGFTVAVKVPQTAEEYDQLAGRVGAILDDAISNVVYRGVLTGVRADFCEELEKATGIARKQSPTGKKKKDAAGVEVDIMAYDESEAKYAARVQAELKLTDEAFVAAYQALMDKVVADEANSFDPSETKREAKAKKLPESYLVAATRVFANGNEQKIAARLLAESGTAVNFVPVEGDEAAQTAAKAKNIELLGWAIRTNELFLEKQRAVTYA